MTEIAQGALGSAGKYDVSFSGGKVLVKGAFSEGGFTADLSLTLDSKVVLDALAAKVGGIAPEVAKIIETALAAE